LRSLGGDRSLKVKIEREKSRIEAERRELKHSSKIRVDQLPGQLKKNKGRLVQGNVITVTKNEGERKGSATLADFSSDLMVLCPDQGKEGRNRRGENRVSSTKNKKG